MSDELEQLLRSMPLAKPSAALDRRIDALLAERPAVAGRIGRWAPWLMAGASLAAAAAIALVAMVPAGVQTTAAPTVAAAPPEAPVFIEYEESWSSLSSQGVVFVDAHTPGYAVQEDVVQQVTYLDPRGGVEITWAWPTQDTWIVPIEYQ